MKTPLAALNPSQRILMGPGPSDVPIRVLRALAAPTIGHLDPEYLAMMDETRRLMQHVFATRNDMTLAVSGTRPVDFYGRMGGNVPTVEEVLSVVMDKVVAAAAVA